MTRFDVIYALDTALREAVRDGLDAAFIREVVETVLRDEAKS